MKKELELEDGSEVDIHLTSLRATLKKIPNWKTPYNDGIRGFWFKKLTSIYERWARQVSKYQPEASIPE